MVFFLSILGVLDPGVWVWMFLTKILPGPNFFKPSEPGGLRIFRAFASLFDWQLKVGSPAWLAAAANDRARSHSSSLQFRLHFHRHFAPDYIFIVTLLQITFSSSLCSRLHSFSLCVRSLSLLLCAIRCMCSKTNFGSCARNFYKKFGPKKYS